MCWKLKSQTLEIGEKYMNKLRLKQNSTMMKLNQNVDSDQEIVTELIESRKMMQNRGNDEKKSNTKSIEQSKQETDQTNRTQLIRRKTKDEIR